MRRIISQSRWFLRLEFRIFIALVALFAPFFPQLLPPSTHRFLAFAQEMKSENFKLQGGNFNMTSGTTNSSGYTLSDVVGETAAGQFASKGYLINAGFLNSAATSTIAFSLSPILVDFGALTPNNPIEQSVIIKITTGKVPGYTVTVIENQPLSTVNKAEIADTACVTKGTPCTYTQAQKWTRAGSFGFGYTMAGTTVSRDFTDSTFYRPFPAVIRGDQPALIMNHQEEGVTHDARMTLRLVVNENQPVGTYTNSILFSALGGI